MKKRGMWCMIRVSDEYKVDNPVTRALGQAHFEQNASPAMKVLMDQMGAMNSRLNFLDGFVRSFSGDAHKQYTENMAMVKALFALPPGSLLIQLKSSHLFEGSNLKTLLESYQQKFGAAVLVAASDNIAQIMVPESAGRITMKELRPPWSYLHDCEIKIIPQT
jgi:hypothetical protein